jgi:hypothetical protein
MWGLGFIASQFAPATVINLGSAWIKSALAAA